MSRLSSVRRRKRHERRHIAQHRLSQWTQSLIGQKPTFDESTGIVNNSGSWPEWNNVEETLKYLRDKCLS